MERREPGIEGWGEISFKGYIYEVVEEKNGMQKPQWECAFRRKELKQELELFFGFGNNGVTRA